MECTPTAIQYSLEEIKNILVNGIDIANEKMRLNAWGNKETGR